MRNERGAAALELAIAAPVLLLLLAVMLAGGRVISVRASLSSIARESARAASQEPDSSSAAAVAREVAIREAELSALEPDRLAIDYEGGDFARGARLAVTVSYEVRLADLPGFRLIPPSLTLTARQVETVERYKSR